MAKPRAVVLITVIGLLAISGVAMAADENDDTVFNSGADTGPDGEAFLFWNVTSLENGDDDFSSLDDSCALQGESPYTYVYDGEVFQLDGYADDGTCGQFQGGDVTANDHPLNHGAYMSFINSLYEGKGRGCINRHLAQTDLGKAVDETPGSIDFQTVAADCQHGDDKTEGQRGDSSDDQHGQDGTHGRSGDAPGHNK